MEHDAPLPSQSAAPAKNGRTACGRRGGGPRPPPRLGSASPGPRRRREPARRATPRPKPPSRAGAVLSEEAPRALSVPTLWPVYRAPPAVRGPTFPWRRRSRPSGRSGARATRGARPRLRGIRSNFAKTSMTAPAPRCAQGILEAAAERTGHLEAAAEVWFPRRDRAIQEVGALARDGDLLREPAARLHVRRLADAHLVPEDRRAVRLLGIRGTHRGRGGRGAGNARARPPRSPRRCCRSSGTYADAPSDTRWRATDQRFRWCAASSACISWTAATAAAPETTRRQTIRGSPPSTRF